jgi:hypothetical protein
MAAKQLPHKFVNGDRVHFCNKPDREGEVIRVRTGHTASRSCSQDEVFVEYGDGVRQWYRAYELKPVKRCKPESKSKPYKQKFSVGDMVSSSLMCPDWRGRVVKVVGCAEAKYVGGLFLLEMNDGSRFEWYGDHLSLALNDGNIEVGDEIKIVGNETHKGRKGRVTATQIEKGHKLLHVHFPSSSHRVSCNEWFGQHQLKLLTSHSNLTSTETDAQGGNEMRYETYPQFNGNEIDTSKPFWIIFCPRCNNVTLKQTEADAKAEAERLTQLTGDSHVLFEQKGTCSPQKMVTWS